MSGEHEETRANEDLVRDLTRSGVLGDAWAQAFRAVPRGRFLPDVVWAYDMATGRSTAVDRRAAPQAWLRAAYRDVPLVTQWDDGDHAGHDPGRTATSSASMPSVVAGMLRDLDVREGHRVLEIGTGTGWNAALLAHRLGDRRVTTVEIDPAVAAQARKTLRQAGVRAETECADGVSGHPAAAPYDRVIATAAVRALPPQWLRQTRPGGVVLAPWGTNYSDQDALVRLTVARDGTAAGPFLRMVEFMKLRAHRLDWDRFRPYVPDFPGAAAVSRTSLVLDDLGDRYDTGRFVLGLRVPDCAHVVNRREDGFARAWFFDLRGRSWAAVEFPQGRVYEQGPRSLWREVEAALAWWDGRGRPELRRFGLAVAAGGESRVMLDGVEVLTASC